MTRALRPLLLAAMLAGGSAAALLGPASAPAAAQSLFAPVATVDGAVITNFELQQRARLVVLFRTPGDPRELALQALIDERLQTAAARDMGIEVTEAEVREGVEEFAGRVNMDSPALLSALAGDGIERQTLEDFVRAGLAWRKVVRARFGPKAQLREEEVRREARALPPGGGIRVGLAEIILPANTPENRARAEALAAQITQIDSLGAFASAARQYSVVPSRDNGGRIEATDLGDLPPNIAELLLPLRPGQVTPPVPIPNGIALFQLRTREETARQTPPATEVEYALLALPGAGGADTRQRAAAISARADTCDDLYGVARGLPAEALRRETRRIDAIPADVAITLSRLDEGETATVVSADGRGATLVMLCGRDYRAGRDVDLRAFGEQLGNSRAAGYADTYLAKLRSNARIVTE
ncbi:peptidylprolyl isomerase [Profundibacterium mesophilum]|uniref:Parvulin-like PPIase n=1 Tax=Profundibacterium mesophilum KAUST100406-0324 TaxID=1037889 RepID=A0A921NRG8_9RHOB|nr:peptidylprolyl isomerase [Profundibacterium mesophilum]KAF0674929.1 peptidyl-prolyl cis-trans isomerase SurA [Profundibacterium mesophilum KAUST100406-0324]